MNTTQLQYVKQALKLALDYVRLPKSEPAGSNQLNLHTNHEKHLERQIQNAQSLVGNELAPVYHDQNVLPFVLGATYLFIVNHEPKFVLDDWAAADTTYNYMRRHKADLFIADLRVKPVIHNPLDDDDVEAAIL